MRVDQAFKKCGFEIVEANKADKELVFLVRVPLQSPIIPMRWKAMMEAVLPVAEDVASKATIKWGLDISKRFFSKNGSVRYFWRVRMSGDLAACQVALVQAALNALRTGNELTSVPLIGNTGTQPDPANGKYKGAYPRGEDDRASHVIAAAFSVGVG